MRCIGEGSGKGERRREGAREGAREREDTQSEEAAGLLCADVPERGEETGAEEHVNREVKTSRRSEE